MKVLDIGCCQGGAAAGYKRAGFKVVGVDMAPQPRYCGDEFMQADGLEVLADLAFVRSFDLVHTSWPCQGYTLAQRIQGREHPKLIEPGRALLEAAGVPYVQENVQGAPLLNPVTLCGAMFGLHTYRHRLFEASFSLVAPPHPLHVQRQVKMGRPIREGDFYQAVGNFNGVGYARKDMGVEWMNRDGVRECVPPAYTQFIGEAFLSS